MKMLAIAAVALKRFGRDRANLFFVFILPIGIIILIGAQFGSGFEPGMGVHDPDDAGRFGDAIVEALEQSGEVDVERYASRAALEEAVALGRIETGVGLPNDLTARIEAGESLTVELIGPEGVQIGAYQALVAEAVASAVEREVAARYLVTRGATVEEAVAAIENVAAEVPAIAVTSTEIGESPFE